MDPASIIGIVDASIDLAFKCGSTVNQLNALVSQYKHARLTMSSMVQNLDSLQLAWNRISVWLRSYMPDQDAVENGLVERLQRFLETGALVMEALNEDLSTYNPNDLGFTKRSRLIWNGKALQNHRSRLRDQATSMTLLLQAIQLPTIHETKEKLRTARKQFQKSDESAYSIVPSRMSSRRSTSTKQTCNGDNLNDDDDMSYRQLSFENDLFTAKVYKRSYRTPLIQHLFRREIQGESNTATITEPKRTFRSKFPKTQERLIDSHEGDPPIINPPDDPGDKQSNNVLDDVTPFVPKVGEVSALQRRPRISKNYGGVTRQTPSDRAGAPRRKKEIKAISSLKPIAEDPTVYSSRNISSRFFPVSDRIIVGDDADYMNSKELREVMEQDRIHLEKKRISESMELHRRLKPKKHKMPRFRVDCEQDKGEWKMPPIRRVKDSFVSVVYREPASAVLTDASNSMNLDTEAPFAEVNARCAPHRTTKGS